MSYSWTDDYSIQDASDSRPPGALLHRLDCERGNHEVGEVIYMGVGGSAKVADCVWCAGKFGTWAARQRKGGRPT